MIRERAQLPVNGKECVIQPCTPGGFILLADGYELTDPNPRWLSESALFSGALNVRWDFDLNEARQYV